MFKDILLEVSAHEIFRIHVKNYLSTHTASRVDVILEDDMLFLKFWFTDRRVFTYTVYDVSDKILLGISSETVALAALNRYKNFVMKKFFPTK